MQRRFNDDDIYIVHQEKKHIAGRVSYKNSGYGDTEHSSVKHQLEFANKKHGSGHVAVKGRDIKDQESFTLKEDMEQKYQAPFSFAKEIAESFSPKVLTESTHDDGTPKSTGNAFDLAAFKKKKEEENLRNHDKQKTATGAVYKRKEDAAGADTTDTKPEEKRGRGRPAGKYGSYKKRIKEALEINELSKATLGKYIKRAGQDRVKRTTREHELDTKNDQLSNAMHNIDDRDARDAIHTARTAVWNQRSKNDDKMLKRSDGINKAIKRLTKEDTDE